MHAASTAANKKEIVRIFFICLPPIRCGNEFRQYRTELAVQDTYGQIYLTRQIFRQIV
jgi:hypothetical protein